MQKWSAYVDNDCFNALPRGLVPLPFRIETREMCEERRARSNAGL